MDVRRGALPARRSFQVLHLLAHLLDRDLHLHRDARSARAPPTSSPACWPRAAVPGSGSRAACRPRRPCRAGGRSRRGARAAAPAPRRRRCGWRSAAASSSARSCASPRRGTLRRRRPPRAPRSSARESALLALHHRRHQRLGLRGQLAQLRRRAPAARRPAARLRARALRARPSTPRRAAASAASSSSAGAPLAAPLQRLVDRQRRAPWAASPAPSPPAGPAGCSCRGVRLGQALSSPAAVDAQLDLAALEARP